jgi:hypothetical protein
MRTWEFLDCMVASTNRIQSLLLASSWIKRWIVAVVPSYLNCGTFLKKLLPVYVKIYTLTFR